MEQLVLDLHEYKIIEFGNFTLKNGNSSRIYIDLRKLVSFPDLLLKITNLLCRKIQEIPKNTKPKLLCGVPMGGIPLAVAMSINTKIPAIMMRKDVKTHGTGRKIEGVFRNDEHCLVIEDVITTGNSVEQAREDLNLYRINPSNVMCVFTYLSPEECRRKHYKYIINIYDIVQVLAKHKKLSRDVILDLYKKYKFESVFYDSLLKQDLFSLNIGRKLCQFRNRSKICLSLDLENTSEIMNIINQVGSQISILKIHSDIITDFTHSFAESLKHLATHYGFLIMEDRKFCDIGNTVVKQLTNGPAKIANWADIVTVHAIAGPGTIEAIIRARKDLAIVIVAEMSSEGNLTDETYTRRAVELAARFPENVVGFVSQRKLSDDPTLFTFMPGISCVREKDDLGQRYKSPSEATRTGADFLIIGRDIYQAADPKSYIEKISI